jgi:hypothetical protein
MDRSLRAPFRLRLRIVMLIMFFIAAAMIAGQPLFCRAYVPPQPAAEIAV